MHWSVHSALGLAAVAMATAVGAPAAAQSKRPTIAVLAFEYGTVQQWWQGTWDIGEGISDLIVDELVNDGSFRVIERKRLNTMLAEQNFSNSDRIDPTAKLAKIGKMVGVKYVVVGIDHQVRHGEEQQRRWRRRLWQRLRYRLGRHLQGEGERGHHGANHRR